MAKNPPYQITETTLKLIADISEKIGVIKAYRLAQPPAELRKRNQIKTIASSLSIEGNTLGEQQITALLNNKRVLAPAKDILEVENAVLVYQNMNQYHPFKMSDLLAAHRVLMKGLVNTPGKLRTSGVGVVKGSYVKHLAPPGPMVKGLMSDLFDYLKSNQEPALLKSCVFHYELEFIHPFADGNGRIGRLWQSLILMQDYPLFEFLPVESLVKQSQQEYYRALEASDKTGGATPFIEFMLEIILIALNELADSQKPKTGVWERLDIFRRKIKDAEFSRKEYMRCFKEISSATASRDLKAGVDKGILIRKGDKRLARYKYILPV